MELEKRGSSIVFNHFNKAQRDHKGSHGGKELTKLAGDIYKLPDFQNRFSS